MNSQIYHAVNYALANVVFTKVDVKEMDVIYAAVITSAYGDGTHNYILAFVPAHLGIVDRAYLRELPWHNLQTRRMKSIYRIPPQRWDMPHNVPSVRLEIRERTPRYSSYGPMNGENFTILLLHDDKKRTTYQYYNHTGLMQALLTYQCVLNNDGGGVPWGVGADTIHSEEGSYELI
jgi:hypothetical protein